MSINLISNWGYILFIFPSWQLINGSKTFHINLKKKPKLIRDNWNKTYQCLIDHELETSFLNYKYLIHAILCTNLRLSWSATNSNIPYTVYIYAQQSNVPEKLSTFTSVLKSTNNTCQWPRPTGRRSLCTSF